MSKYPKLSYTASTRYLVHAPKIIQIAQVLKVVLRPTFSIMDIAGKFKNTYQRKNMATHVFTTVVVVSYMTATTEETGVNVSITNEFEAKHMKCVIIITHLYDDNSYFLSLSSSSSLI